MVKISIENLKKGLAEAKKKYEAAKIFSDTLLSAEKAGLLEVLCFSSLAVNLTKDADQQIRSNLKNLPSTESRNQIIKHKVGDLWGLSLTLDKNLKVLENSIESAQNKAELLADFDSLLRNTLECLSAFEKFNHEELKSEELSSAISYTYSNIKASNIRSLSVHALPYMNSLA